MSQWPAKVEICICRVPIRKKDGYSIEMVRSFAQKLKSCMVPNGIVFLIAYAPTEDKARPFEISRAMTEVGFHHVDNIVIVKSWFPGKKSESNLVNSHEYVLYFCNGDVWKLDRAPLCEYLRIPGKSTCCGNTWTIETGSLDDSYPVDLAELLIRMTDVLPASMIFDPFMSSTAALRAALKLGHSFFGFETDRRRLTRYKQIVKEHQEMIKKNEEK
jgi:hypothetical protein